MEGNSGSTDFAAAQYFNSYVAPTVMIRRRNLDEEDDIFDFACFGADEQVIKLDFIDNVNKSNEAYYRIIFNPSNAAIDNKTYMKQRIKADGKRYRLRRNQYSWPEDQYIFAGWTFTPNPPINSVDTDSLHGFYTDTQQITSTEIEMLMATMPTPKILRSGDQVVLYAVWISHNFTASDTTLTLRPPAGKTQFKISGIDTFVNPENSKIGDRVIIKFEDAD